MSARYELDHQQQVDNGHPKVASPKSKKNKNKAQSANNLAVPVLETFRSRTGSLVSFNTKCELYEIERERDKHPPKPAAVFSLRYYIMFLSLFSPFVVTYSRTIINFALTDMINLDIETATEGKEEALTSGIDEKLIKSPETKLDSIDLNDLDQSSQAKGNESFLDALESTVTNKEKETKKYYFELDNSCPVTDEQRTRLSEQLQESKKISASGSRVGQKFDWDASQQGFLKGSYSLGHAMLQVVSSRLSETYGSHKVMSASSALIAFACVAAPFLASAHYVLLVADLFILGVLGSFMTPALITLFTHWLTPSERSIMLSLYLVSSRLGFSLSSAFCGLLIDAKLSWAYLFYSAGATSIIFSILFTLIARSKPHQHPLINDDELKYLASKNTLVREALRAEEKKRRQKGLDANGETIGMHELGATGKLENGNVAEESQGETTVVDGRGKSSEKPKRPSPPWRAIVTSSAVWAFVVTKFCVKLAGDTVSTELPVYSSRVMHMSPSMNGLINASSYAFFCVGCLIVGALARYANKHHPFGWSKTTVRKVFQCTASFGVSIILILLSMSICQERTTIVLLMLFFLITTLSTGGEAQIPLDISERYAGTIHAIGSSLAISGAIEPVLVGFFLKNHSADKNKWRFVWLGASAIAFIGGLTFLIFGDATIQPFDRINADPEEQQQQQAKKLKLLEASESGQDKENNLEGACYTNKSFAPVASETCEANTTTTDVVSPSAQKCEQDSPPAHGESVVT